MAKKVARKRDWLVEGAGLLRRTLDAVAPTPGGGPPPAIRTLRTWLGVLIAVVAGLLVGGAVGLLGVLAWQALPDAPLFLLGLVVGVAVGFGISIAAALAVTFGRRRGFGKLILLPLVAVAAPFLLLGTAWDALSGRRKKRARA
jgi:hypothetical protein